MSSGQDVGGASSALFVPGHRSDRYEKAAAIGAGFVIVDLEDAVGEEHKAAARDAAYIGLTQPDSTFQAAVRINAPLTADDPDVELVTRIADQAPDSLLAVVIPKAEHPLVIARVAARLGSTPIIPLIETALGIESAAALAAAPNVVRLAFGAIDFGVDIDATSPVILDYARSRLVIASRVAGLRAPLDSPNPEFRELDEVRRGAASARSLGFGGQLCIHPAQVRVVQQAFLPGAAEIAWARRVVEIGDGSAGQVDGSMVDRPVYVRAVAILRRANHSAS